MRALTLEPSGMDAQGAVSEGEESEPERASPCPGMGRLLEIAEMGGALSRLILRSNCLAACWRSICSGSQRLRLSVRSERKVA